MAKNAIQVEICVCSRLSPNVEHFATCFWQFHTLDTSRVSKMNIVIKTQDKLAYMILIKKTVSNPVPCVIIALNYFIKKRQF